MLKPRPKFLILLLLREANIVVTILTAISILYLRSVHSIWFGLGTLIATGTAKLLKKCIRQPRPSESSKTTYGMPSTHSSSIAFFGVYLFLSCLLLPIDPKILSLLPGSYRFQGFDTRDSDDSFIQESNQELEVDPNDISSSSSNISNFLIRLMFGLMFVSIALSVCWSRVKFGHHSPKQVVVGGLVGGTIGWLWFGIWVGLKIPRFFLIFFNQNLYYNPSTLNSSPMTRTTRPSSNMIKDEDDLIKIPSNSFSHLKNQVEESNFFIKFEGIGDRLNLAYELIRNILIEAWKLRDFGLVWDSLLRPNLNYLGDFLGFQNEIFPNSLPPNTNLHPL